jgi:hypothetical protein
MTKGHKELLLRRSPFFRISLTYNASNFSSSIPNTNIATTIAITTAPLRQNVPLLRPYRYQLCIKYPDETKTTTKRRKRPDEGGAVANSKAKLKKKRNVEVEKMKLSTSFAPSPPPTSGSNMKQEDTNVDIGLHERQDQHQLKANYQLGVELSASQEPPLSIFLLNIARQPTAHKRGQHVVPEREPPPHGI